MRTLNLRNIPDDLHKAVELLSVERNTTIERLVILALQEYLKRNKETGK